MQNLQEINSCKNKDTPKRAKSALVLADSFLEIADRSLRQIVLVHMSDNSIVRIKNVI